MAKNVSKIVDYVKRVKGRGKAARQMLARGLKEGTEKASKGIVPALVVGSAVQTGGLALANHGKLSIPIRGYRVPVIGTLATIILGTLGWILRKRPMSKVLYASATAMGISQIADLVKFGWKVKPAANTPAEPAEKKAP